MITTLQTADGSSPEENTPKAVLQPTTGKARITRGPRAGMIVDVESWGEFVTARLVDERGNVHKFRSPSSYFSAIEEAPKVEEKKEPSTKTTKKKTAKKTTRRKKST